MLQTASLNGKKKEKSSERVLREQDYIWNVFIIMDGVEGMISTNSGH